MSSVMIFTQGNRKRCCDAKCHNGNQPECECICQGANHGKGYEIALRNVEEMVKKELQVQDKFLEKRGDKYYLVDYKQEALFS